MPTQTVAGSPWQTTQTTVDRLTLVPGAWPSETRIQGAASRVGTKNLDQPALLGEREQTNFFFLLLLGDTPLGWRNIDELTEWKPRTNTHKLRDGKRWTFLSHTFFYLLILAFSHSDGVSSLLWALGFGTLSCLPVHNAPVFFLSFSL
jgi:hypothetical protein